LLAVLGGAALGQPPTLAEELVPARYTIWPTPLLTMAQPGQGPEKKEKAPPTSAKKETTPQQAAPAENPFDANNQENDTGGELASLSAPNMIGHLLGAGKSISFFVNRLNGATFLNALGSTNLVNPAVADNNSPVPRDRVFFRYNHFDDALSVTGASGQTAPFAGAPGGVRSLTTTQPYNVDEYTFGFEKTFLEKRASIEFRLPFSTGLAPNLDLSYGSLGSNATVNSSMPNPFTTGPVFKDVIPTPQNTLGQSGTQFGNLTLIFKWLFLERDWLYLSGGLALGVPTGNNTHVRVTDFLGPTPSEADTIRFRDFLVHNQTWSLSPYFAGLITPTDRFFAQGFCQFDVPLNSSLVSYNEVVQHTQFPAGSNMPLVTLPVNNFNDHIREQYLMHLDIGTGYWLVRNPEARWLTGLAPTVEGHYTTTLTNANIVTLPGDTTRFIAANGSQFMAPPPQVGNLHNRVDIIDLTLGTTFEFGGRTRLATAFALPLRGADNRTYNWEFQLQLNYYFGANRATRLPPGPNF
jgi:hypothetical protein